MSFTTFDSNSGGTPPTLSLAGFVPNTWNTMSPTQGQSANALTLIITTDSSHNPTVGWRQTGQAGYTQTGIIGAGRQCYAVVGLLGGQFDLYLSGTAGVTIYIYASHGPEYVPVTPASLAALTGSYNNYNVSAQTAQNAIAAVLHVTQSAAVDFRYGASGASSDVFTNGNEGNLQRDFIVGLDGSQNFQGFGGASASAPVLVGYFTAGIVWHINAVAVTPGAAGSFQNLTPAGGDTSPLGFIFDNQLTSGTYTYSLSEQGSGFALNAGPVGNWHGMAIAANPAQINMSQIATATLWERGYFTGFTPASYSLHSHLEF